MTDSTQSHGHATTDTSPPARLHVVVGYDGTPPASRALDAAVRLLRGREGSIEVWITTKLITHAPGPRNLGNSTITRCEHTDPMG